MKYTYFSKRLVATLALTASLTAMASTLSPQQALSRACRQSPAPMRSAAAAQLPQWQLTNTTLSADGNPACYIFTPQQDQGFIVVSASDEAPAILGYSDSGSIGANLPENLRWWLSQYAAQIQAAEAHGKLLMVARPERESILPLVKTFWNQDAPFNDKCPEINGEHAVTGCVATAMAQVTNYHQWPKKGKGTGSVKVGDTTYTFDFGATEFDWDNMLDRYDSSSPAAANDAVATLMYACGVASDMDYTTTESGASAVTAAQGMLKYLDYDVSLGYVMREGYGLLDWEQLVYDQLKDVGPVLYTGTAQIGGHAFVCDGYSQDGYFHINWGWGGLSDGYFLLTALAPAMQGIGGADSAFDFDQGILINIMPPKEGSKPYVSLLCDSYSVGEMTGYEPAAYSIGGGVYSLGPSTVSVTIGSAFEPAGGGETQYSEFNTASLQPMEGYSSWQVTIPASLADGTYKMYPAYKTEYSDWAPIPVSQSGIPYATLTMAEGQPTVSSPEEVTPTVSDIVFKTPIYSGRNAVITAKITNSDTREFYSEVYGCLVQNGMMGDQLCGIGIPMMPDLLGGQSTEFTYTSPFVVPEESDESGESATRTTSETQYVQPGSYQFCFVIENSQGEMTPISPLMDITVEENVATELQASAPTLEGGGTEVTDPAHFAVETAVACQAGFYEGTFALPVFDSTNKQVAVFYSEQCLLKSGEQLTVKTGGDLSEAVPGAQYVCALFMKSDSGEWEQLSQSLAFTIADPSGVEAVGADQPECTRFSLDGLQIPEGSRNPGIYIQVMKYADGKRVILKRTTLK